jgi:hypothetical protein
LDGCDWETFVWWRLESSVLTVVMANGRVVAP